MFKVCADLLAGLHVCEILEEDLAVLTKGERVALEMDALLKLNEEDQSSSLLR
jgi:hypothetical protein